MVLIVRTPVETTQLQILDMPVVDMPVVVQRQVDMVLTVQQNLVEIPQLQVLDKVVGMPVVMQ